MPRHARPVLQVLTLTLAGALVSVSGCTCMGPPCTFRVKEGGSSYVACYEGSRSTEERCSAVSGKITLVSGSKPEFGGKSCAEVFSSSSAEKECPGYAGLWVDPGAVDPATQFPAHCAEVVAGLALSPDGVPDLCRCDTVQDRTDGRVHICTEGHGSLCDPANAGSGFTCDQGTNDYAAGAGCAKSGRALCCVGASGLITFTFDDCNHKLCSQATFEANCANVSGSLVDCSTL